MLKSNLNPILCFKKILILWNWNRTGMELEHEQLVKGVNKCELEKKEIMLVERLIGTEKRRNTF